MTVLKKPSKKIYFILIFILIALFGFCYYYLRKTAITFDSGDSKNTVIMNVMNVSKSINTPEIHVFSRIKTDEAFKIKSRINETVLNVLVKRGQHVKQGDALVMLKNDKEKALLDHAKLALENSTKELKRKQVLFDKNLISKSDLDRVSSALYTDKLRYQNDLEMYENTIIKAPSHALVADLNVKVGQLVLPNQVLVELKTDNGKYAVASVAEKYFQIFKSMVSDKSKHTAIISYQGTPLSLQLVSIDPEINPGEIGFNSYYQFTKDVSAPVGKIFRMTAKLLPIKNSLLIPDASLYYDDVGPYVYIVGSDKKLKQVQVKFNGYRFDNKVLYSVISSDKLLDGAQLVLTYVDYIDLGKTVVPKSVSN